VNAGSWQTYTQPLAITWSGITEVAYCSADLSGNVEAAQFSTVKIDLEPGPEHSIYLPPVVKVQ